MTWGAFQGGFQPSRNKPTSRVYTPIPYVIEDPLNDNVVLYLKLEDDLLDYSPLAQTGVISNAGGFALGQLDGENCFLSPTNSAGYFIIPGNKLQVNGSTQFTIEWLVNRTGGTSDNMFTNYHITAGQLTAFFLATSYFEVYHNQGSVSYSASISNNTWTHYAFCRNGNLYEAFVGGQKVASQVKTTGITLGANRNHYWGRPIGDNNLDGWRFYGGVKKFRVTDGIARYNANFDPVLDTYLL